MLDVDYEYSQLQGDFMYFFDFIMRNAKNPISAFNYDRVKLPLTKIFEILDINETHNRVGLEEFDPVFRPSDRRIIRHRLRQAHQIDVKMTNKEFNALFDLSKENIQHLLSQSSNA